MIGRRPTDGELYMAHFMGVGGAGKLISTAEDNPQASGAALFPNAAAANRSIFFDRSGRARSVSEVYSVLNARYAGAASSSATRSAMAAFGATPSSATGPGTSVVKPAFLSSFPDVARRRRRRLLRPRQTLRRRPSRCSVRCSRSATELSRFRLPFMNYGATPRR